MPDSGDPTYRHHYRARGEAVTLREPEDLDGEDGVFEVRMPIASTGEVRNEGDDPLTREEIDGMAEQLEARQIGVFPAHGNDSKISAARYSPFERLGDWRDSDVETREGDAEVLMATARMPDPETLPAATGSYREGLAILKEQAKRGIGQDSSIGWRDDDAFPGGVDLMEASIVGIGADWRTNTGDESAEVVARAVAEASHTFDMGAFIRGLRDGGMRPLGPPEDPDRFDTFEECVEALQADEDLSREEAERICGSWETDKDDQATETNTDHDMTDDTDSDQATDDAPDDTQDEDDTLSAEEFRSEMLDLQRQQMDVLETLATDEDEMDDDEEEDDEDEDEQSASTEDADTDDGEESDVERKVSELETELQELRQNGLSTEDVDVDVGDESDEEEPDDERNADDTDDTDTDDSPNEIDPRAKWGI